MNHYSALMRSTWRLGRAFQGFLLAVTAVGSHAGTTGVTERPNVVFILVDDMGYHDLGCYGSEVAYTPHLDRMASEGMRFTQAYAGSAVCAPSRSTLMTGRHAGRSPVRGNTGGIPLRPQDETLAELFQWAGYRTGGFGKWGLGDIGTTGAPEKKGFDEFFGYYHQVHAHNYYPRYLVSNGEKVDLPGRRAVEEAYSHYRIVERTLAFIREHADQRFFCLAAWTPPHGKYQIPRSDPAWERFKEKNWSRAARTHAAFTSMIDRHVGELMALLRELELEEETLVFFGSDNGPSYRFEGSLRSAGEWRGQKGTMYEGGLRIPMIVRWAGQIPAASVSDLPWYFPDVLPTLAELVGVEEWVPDEAGGLSILPTLLGEERVGRSQERHDHLYWEYPPYDWILGRYHPNGLRQAVRSGDWKLVRHGHQSPWQLYDIDEDPGERTDLAGQHREVVERLSGYAERAHTSPPPQWEPATPRGRRYR